MFKKKNLPRLSQAERGIGCPRIHAGKGASCSSGRASSNSGGVRQLDCRCASQILASKSKAENSKEMVGKASKCWGETEWSYRKAVDGEKGA